MEEKNQNGPVSRKSNENSFQKDWQMIVNAVQQPRTIRTEHCPSVVGDFNEGPFQGSNEGRSWALGDDDRETSTRRSNYEGIQQWRGEEGSCYRGECGTQWEVFMRKVWVWWHQMKCWWERTEKEAEVNMTEERESNCYKEVKSRQSGEDWPSVEGSLLHCDRRASVCHSLAAVQPAG